ERQRHNNRPPADGVFLRQPDRSVGSGAACALRGAEGWITMATSTRRGINAAAVTRAADAMLRCLGGAEITLVLPAMAMPTDASSQLGLVDPGVEQVPLAPVVVRNLPTAITGPRRRMEFLAPVAAVANEVETRNLASADALFDGALGVM